jgi:hypothetical protein
MTEHLFTSAHDALTFAFRFSHQASPKTPMSTLLSGLGIGSGKGLVGIDGAAQSGLILSAVGHLPVDQKQVLTVRYGDVPIECSCCGAEGRSKEWMAAVDDLSHRIDTIRDLHQRDRRAIVVKVLCRRRGEILRRVAAEYGVAERTMKRRYRDAKDVLSKIEIRAVGTMQSWLEGEPIDIPTAYADDSLYASQLAKRAARRSRDADLTA